MLETIWGIQINWWNLWNKKRKKRRERLWMWNYFCCLVANVLLRGILRYYIFTSNKCIDMMFLFYRIPECFSKHWNWRARLFIKRFRQDAFSARIRRVSKDRTMYVPHCNATNEHDCDKSLLITDLYLAFSYRYRTVPWYLTAVVSAHPWSPTCSHKQPRAIRAGALNLHRTRTCLSKSISSHGESWICQCYTSDTLFSDLGVVQNFN